MLTTQDALSRIVGVEEHVVLSALLSRLPKAAVVEQGYFSRDEPFGTFSLLEKMSDTEDRLSALDAAGLNVQILSYPLAGGDVLPAGEAPQWARRANDAIHERIVAHPDRYAGLAHVPLADPQAAADELERAITQLGFKGALVNGATAGRYLDDPAFEPVLARAERLGVPIYLHPAPPPRAAREALYAGLPNDFSFWMSVSGWGWHADAATDVLRLLLSGALQRHAGLKLVVGHLGEGLQVMLPRLDQQFHTGTRFDGIPSELLRKHLWVSAGGFFFLPLFMAALDAFGPDRMLYSVDYPFGSLEEGHAFLERLPVDADTPARIAHRNADALSGLSGGG